MELDDKMFYKIVVECGHVGAGKGYDVVRYFQGENVPDVLTVIKKMPRVKAKKTSKSVKLIKSITEKEYRSGLDVQHANPYLVKVHCPG